MPRVATRIARRGNTTAIVLSLPNRLDTVTTRLRLKASTFATVPRFAPLERRRFVEANLAMGRT